MTLFVIAYTISIMIALGVGIRVGMQLERGHSVLWTEDEIRKKIRSN